MRGSEEGAAVGGRYMFETNHVYIVGTIRGRDCGVGPRTARARNGIVQLYARNRSPPVVYRELGIFKSDKLSLMGLFTPT